jgi:hypothetical protein
VPQAAHEEHVFQREARRVTRVRRRVSAAAVVCAAMLGAAESAAQGVDELGPYADYRGTERETPQDMAVELRFGRYRPNVDSEFGGTGPYQTIFGTDVRYQFGFEVDWQLLRIPRFGTFGPGLGVEVTRSKGRALLSDGSGERSAQDSTLWVAPLYVVGVLRADVVARETFVPLVPYAKAGVGYALWWSSDGDGLAEASGSKALGTSFGYQFALGVMLLLDFIDEADAKAMDHATGVNNSYLFIEWYVSDLGAGDQMQVGTNTWAAGLAFEF